MQRPRAQAVFLAASLVCLAIGLLAASRSTSRPAVEMESCVRSGAVEVVRVVPGGAADRAGVRVGDHLVALAGLELGASADVEFALVDRRVGEAVPLVIRLPVSDDLQRTIPIQIRVSSPDGELVIAATFKTGAEIGTATTAR